MVTRPADGPPRRQGPQGLFAALWALLRTPVPPERRGVLTFGWLILLLFGAQLVTGVLLSVYYEPAPESAATSVRFLMRDVDNGWLVRGLHHWSATAILALAVLQLVRVLATRAYRGRAWSWYLGLALFGLIAAQAFTGGLLPWDEGAYRTAASALQRLEGVPLVGHALASFLRGGAVVAGHTLSRAYTLHVLLLPWISLAVVALNVWMLVRRRAQGAAR
jgi:quinol---cytochrome c reductase cytochrome b subunit, bacillus type